jgi:hypothetical protein
MSTYKVLGQALAAVMSRGLHYLRPIQASLKRAADFDPNFRRFDAHYSGLYFGASIAAPIHLAQRKIPSSEQIRTV